MWHFCWSSRSDNAFPYRAAANSQTITPGEHTSMRLEVQRKGLPLSRHQRLQRNATLRPPIHPHLISRFAPCSLRVHRVLSASILIFAQPLKHRASGAHGEGVGCAPPLPTRSDRCVLSAWLDAHPTTDRTHSPKQRAGALSESRGPTSREKVGRRMVDRALGTTQTPHLVEVRQERESKRGAKLPGNCTPAILIDMPMSRVVLSFSQFCFRTP